MSKLINLKGKKFNYWTVIRKDINISGQTLWLSKCICGAKRLVGGRNLRLGKSKSCGCVYITKRKEEYAKKRKPFQKKIREVLHAMHQRCEDKSQKLYMNYGGRGIKVCSEWDSFWPFYNWCMSNGYKPGLQIDRINNDGDYSPQNCRFVTPSQNCYNKRNTNKFFYDGRYLTRSEIMELTGFNWVKVSRKFKQKQTIEGDNA